MVGTPPAKGALRAFAQRRRLDIEGNCRARSTLLDGGEQRFLRSLQRWSRQCRRRPVSHDFVEDRDVTVIMDGSRAQAPRLF
jgi:hypothetical protein